MKALQARWLHLRHGRRPDGGYVAVMTGLMLLTFIGLSAFAVDVGHWYQVGQQEQRAADAAAMAGVTYLPGNSTSAFATAQTYSKINGFQHGVSATTVIPALEDSPGRMRVTVSRTVQNFFGSILGIPTTPVSRTAVAEYAAPVPLGSPCNEFGDDPDVAGHKSANCSSSAAFWANVGSLNSPKQNGDAYQNNSCSSEDGCSSGVNTDYDPNGYFYSITVRQAVANLTIEAFDPALINVGDTCGANKLKQAMALSYPTESVVSDPATRYAENTGPFCTGDNRFGGTGEVATQFTVRSPGTKPFDPLSFPPITGCVQTFAGYNGDLSKVLDQTKAQYTARPDVADNFRRWKTLCTVANAQPGTYLIQIKTNGVGNDLANGHNRFSLRAYGGSSADNDAVSVAGYNKMGIYANIPSGTSRLYLAKVPSSAKGQTFNVNLFDIGDGAASGSTVKVLPPAEVGGTFASCAGTGVVNGALTNCQISVDGSYQGKWQKIAVQIPAAYSCTDSATTGCWLRLEFYYGAGSGPTDTTSWTASIVGDPIRLIE